MPPSALALPTSENVAAARGNIRGFAVRTPLLKLIAGPPGVNIDAPKLGAILNGQRPF
jgi:hypothetical protein